MAVKTVICPQCKAEQAILREEESNIMKCAFCEAEMELPEYEEGEEFDYSYEEETEAEKLEPQGEKIEAVFVLNEEEVGNAFDVSGKVKERKYIIYIELALLAFFGLSILVMNVLGLMGKGGIQRPTTTNWLYVVLCFGMIPVVAILPKRTKQKIIRKSTSGNQLEISIYENLFEVHIAGRDEKDDWQQPFDGSYGVIHDRNLFVLTLSNGQILAIPERALTEEQVEIVEQRLLTNLEEN